MAQPPYRIRHLCLLLILFSTASVAAQAQWWRWFHPKVAQIYYVRIDGNNSNTGLANTTTGAWRTIDWAADHASAGAVIRVQAGTYAEQVTPGVSGTVGNPITFVADGGVTFCGMDISSRDYLRVVGFTMDTDAGGCTKNNRVVNVRGTSTGLEFWNNTFRDATESGLASGAYADRQHNFILVGNTFTAIGCCGAAVGLRGNNNLLAYNEVTNVDPDAFVIDGTYSYWLNNYIHDMVITAPAHGDAFQSNSSSLGLSQNTFEANVIVGGGVNLDEHGVLLQNQTMAGCSTGTCGAITENLFRYNLWYHIAGGTIGVDQSVIGGLTNTRVVQDTLVDGLGAYPNVAYDALFNGISITGRIHNTIFHRSWGSNVTANVRGYFATGGASLTSADYNLSFTPDGTPTHTTPWTAQTHPRTNVDPLFVSLGGSDFTLQSGSGARAVGGPLTTTSGSGTGTTFNVVAGGGGWFRGSNANLTVYGGQLTAGDVITVGTDVVTVTSIASEAITVTPSFTWADGEPVYLGTSTTPDIGAYPYKAGGYALTATSSVANGIATITPSDASLVRFVVCYSNGIPVEVDSTSPYTCMVHGVMEIRVYPRYARTTLWVVATP